MQKNKFVFITGCNGQLGKAIARSFKENSWIVFGLDLNRLQNTHVDYYLEGTVKSRNDFEKLFELWPWFRF